MGIFTLGLLVYTKLKKRSSRKRRDKWAVQSSFQPSINTDNGDWARASLRPAPRTISTIPLSSSHHTLPPISTHPVYSEQTIDFTRIGTSKEGDTRQRLQSIVSTLLNHHLPANPSSEALDHFRADRIGSIDDPALFTKSRRPSMVTIGESGRKKSGTSTLGTLNDPSVTSFTIERARRASLSINKVSVSGIEEVIPYASGIMTEPTSPVDLDVRFAKPIAVLARPPSRIDFTQPEGTPRRQGDHLVAAHDPLAHRSPSFQSNRDSLLPYAQDPNPNQQAANSPSLQRPTERNRLPMIDVSPLISPTTTQADNPAHHGQKGTGISTITTPARSGSKKKKRPDSIILAHLRSPKLGGHLTTGHQSSTDSPPPISDALHNLSAGIATSVLAMKSAGGSTNFPYSLPPSASSKTEIPKTPRTATSEGCQSAVSDLESAQLFQAWKGFAPPTHVEEPVPAIKRGLSVQGNTARPRPKAPRRAGTKDGDIDMEIVLNGDARASTQPKNEDQLSISRPIVILTPNTAKEKDFSIEKPGHTHTKRASLTPSVGSASSSTSSNSKLTYLADVVKEEKRLSMLSVINA